MQNIIDISTNTIKQLLNVPKFKNDVSLLYNILDQISIDCDVDLLNKELDDAQQIYIEAKNNNIVDSSILISLNIRDLLQYIGKPIKSNYNTLKLGLICHISDNDLFENVE